VIGPGTSAILSADSDAGRTDSHFDSRDLLVKARLMACSAVTSFEAR
jgi:hypothetical protein